MFVEVSTLKNQLSLEIYLPDRGSYGPNKFTLMFTQSRLLKNCLKASPE